MRPNVHSSVKNSRILQIQQQNDISNLFIVNKGRSANIKSMNSDFEHKALSHSLVRNNFPHISQMKSCQMFSRSGLVLVTRLSGVFYRFVLHLSSISTRSSRPACVLFVLYAYFWMTQKQWQDQSFSCHYETLRPTLFVSVEPPTVDLML